MRLGNVLYVPIWQTAIFPTYLHKSPLLFISFGGDLTYVLFHLLILLLQKDKIDKQTVLSQLEKME